MGDSRMSRQPIKPYVAMAMTVAVLVPMLNCAPLAAAQTQQDSAKWQDRAALLEGQPGLSGQRNGVFREPDPIDFSDHARSNSLFDGKALTGWDGRPGVWRVEGGSIVGE